ncbi:MAG TPA: ABC transporter permease [Gemmatimonadales bacterium]|nr:ABC transporter permease [Gemmatimonadales bacterium]
MSDRSGGPLLQLTLWRLRELWREPEAVFWVFAFPVLLALALGIAFNRRAPQALTVAVVNPAGGREGGRAEVAIALRAAPGLRVVELDSAEAAGRLRVGRVALVVVPGAPVAFRYDSTREESRLARLLANQALQAAGGRRDPLVVRDVTVTEPGSRYIDFLIPGLLGLNIMSTGIWGIGFGVVRTRNRGLLKRLLASPMRRSQFLLSQAAARLVFLVAEVGVVLAFGALAFGVPVRGSAAAVAVIVLAGALAFSGLGLLCASRVKTVEGVSGLINLVMVPMWIFSGVFFSWAHFPEALHPFIQALPLTALNDGLRAVLLEGAGTADMVAPLVNLALWGGATFVVSLRIFRWS